MVALESVDHNDLEQKIEMANEILKIQYSRNRLLIPNDGLGAFGSISASTFRTTTSMQYTQEGFHFYGFYIVKNYRFGENDYLGSK